MAVEIKGRISVDTAAAAKSTKELKDEILATKKALDSAKIGSDEYKAAQKQLQIQQEQLKKSTDEAKTSHEKNGEAFGALKEKLNALVPGLEGASTGVKGLSAQLKALLLNPIVAMLAIIVSVLALVYKAFTNTFEGGEKMEQIFSGIGAAGQALVDNLQRIGGVIKDIFTLNWGDAEKGIDEIVDATATAFNKMAALKKESQQLERDQADNDLDQSKRRRDLSLLKEQQTAGATYELRKAAGEKLMADSRKNAAEDIALAKKIADNKIAQLKVEEDGTRKNYAEIQKIRAQQLDVETQNNQELRAIEKSNNQNEKTEEAEKKQRDKDADVANKARLEKAKAAMKELEKLQEETYKHTLNKQDLAILLLEQKYDKELALLKKFHASTIQLENNFREDMAAVIASGLQKETVEVTKAVGLRIVADNTVKNSALSSTWEIAAAKQIGANIERQISEIKKETAMSEADAYSQAADIVAGVVGKQTGVGKVLSIASALINTYLGITAGVKLGYPQAIPAVAAAAATGFKAVTAIKAVQVPGASGGGGGASPTLVTPPNIAAPVRTSTMLDQSSINAVGNAAQGGVNRAFVLDADIKNNQERANRINRAARLG